MKASSCPRKASLRGGKGKLDGWQEQREVAKRDGKEGWQRGVPERGGKGKEGWQRQGGVAKAKRGGKDKEGWQRQTS